jgi:hypothetical protein
MPLIERVTGPDGATLHLVPIAPERLPKVAVRDLERAWHDAHRHAHHAAKQQKSAPRRAFRFATGAAITLTDDDARLWASAIDQSSDLSTAHGISVCLRLLGLIALIAAAEWCSPHVQFRGDGCPVDARLLKAAALATLNPDGALDPIAVQNLLLRHPLSPS